MIYNFTEDALRLAVINADRLMINALPCEEEIEHGFSHEFEKKMKALISQSKKAVTNNRIYLRKRLIAIIAAVIILMITAMSVSAIRTKVFEFITDVFEKYTHIFFEEPENSESSQSMPNAEFTAYVPSYIPEGFEPDNQIIRDFVLVEYLKGDEIISYTQQRVDEVSMNINTEGVEPEELSFDGKSALYYSNKGMQNLIWYDDKYIFSVSSTLDRESVFKIADGLELYNLIQ